MAGFELENALSKSCRLLAEGGHVAGMIYLDWLEEVLQGAPLVHFFRGL